MTDKTVNVPWKLHTNKIEINFVVINELETKFLAYVDFANANIFPVKSLWKQAFNGPTENLSRRQNLYRKYQDIRGNCYNYND